MAELQDDDVQQLWNLSCLLAQRNLTTQTAQCLEPLCSIDCSVRTPKVQAILLQANILLAEICSVACSNSKKVNNRDIWARRVAKTEKCIDSADSAIARGVPCTVGNKLRLVKVKFLLQQQLKAERSEKNRRILEILCEGLKSCAEGESGNSELAGKFHRYFSVKLKACLVKMHFATFSAKYSGVGGVSSAFVESLKYLRMALPNYVDKNFLLWLVEVTCHTAISSFQPGSTAEMHQLIDFGQDFFDKVAIEISISRDIRIHHSIITVFYYLRVGKVTKIAPLLEQIQILSRNTSEQPTSAIKNAYFDTILKSMRASALAYSDPKLALDLAMNTILSAQTNLKTYDQHPAVRLMLIATLFDMLHLYCKLLGLQCRYAEMGASIVQMTTLFATYKVDLERTIFYRYFLARCHSLIAKYATAIGKVKDACAHLNHVVDKVLPTPTDGEELYPDSYLAVWVDMLEVTMYCCGLATDPTLACNDSSTIEPAKQIYPSRILLDWAARNINLDTLQNQMNKCCSVELQAKFNLALVKWMWATEELSGGHGENYIEHFKLEGLRPKALTLLHEALQHLTTNVICCETTSEIMALFGLRLVALGKLEQDTTFSGGV
ncbi:uncharacterized protein PHALS_07347 [Plasmopara halstedii]|uniref:Uncharacterized protein n=1 Tax=Plasmopara halstedii TaxID=4781 RepID=A0A0P1B488_PLAHL|nr:uncharacterized protein PHALS_07347 [Plasmopara halstedii]CEG49590.1 hypothetical protein PHALS_07347 [Plasmopara halstedii]|eukprot:XP_024585959.1 hypothetical protein PHALS_07347 [Plasmopara halstedii]